MSLKEDTAELFLTLLEGRKGRTYDHVVGELEEILIRRVLQITRGHVSKASRILGMHRTTLVERLRKYDMLEEARQMRIRAGFRDSSTIHDIEEKMEKSYDDHESIGQLGSETGGEKDPSSHR